MSENAVETDTRARGPPPKGLKGVGLKGGSGGQGGPEHIYRHPKCKASEKKYRTNTVTVPEPTRSTIKSMGNREGFACSVGELFEYSARKCRARVEEIVALCKREDKKFFDKSFFYGNRDVMYPDGSPDDCTVTEPEDTARLSDLFPKSRLFDNSGKTCSNDISQGAVGDCFFIGAVSALASCTATHLDPLRRLFVAHSHQYAVYGVMFFKNGSWEWVIVDDIVATGADGKAPLYASASEEELWPMIIEKAYAKVHFCWDSIDGGWGREALADMTSGIEYSLDLKKTKTNQDGFKKVVDDPLTILNCAVGQHVQEEGGAGRAGESGAVFGLFKGHAYSVIRFVTCSNGEAFAITTWSAATIGLIRSLWSLCLPLIGYQRPVKEESSRSLHTVGSMRTPLKSARCSERF